MGVDELQVSRLVKLLRDLGLTEDTTAVGIGKDCIRVYTSAGASLRRKVPRVFEGEVVHVRKIGKVKPT